MKQFKRCMYVSLFICMAALVIPWSALLAQEKGEDLPHPSTYLPSIAQFTDFKKFYDDPRSGWAKYDYRKLTPPVILKYFEIDQEKGKQLWSEAVGFKAPDVVGKIHPEIKPGHYTYKDVQNNPAFKELLTPGMYERMRQPGPPHGMAVPEFDIIPTKQYYYAPSIAQFTLDNQKTGRVKMDDKGYVVWRTWTNGYPFARPSGPMEGMQAMANWFYKREKFENNGTVFQDARSFDKNLKQDAKGIIQWVASGLSGRSMLPPFGYMDESAKERGELWILWGKSFYPREAAGTTFLSTYYIDPDHADTQFIYIPSMRRVRKMSTTDTQDPLPMPGLTDWIGDDLSVLSQKWTPKNFPYKVKVLEKREYLVESPTTDVSQYIKEGDLGYHGMKLERRPMRVLQLDQQDPNYVYSKRWLIQDMETMLIPEHVTYDKKGRRYRGIFVPENFFPYAGQFGWNGYVLYYDYIDTHSSVSLFLEMPVRYTRKDLLTGLTSGAK